MKTLAAVIANAIQTRANQSTPFGFWLANIAFRLHRYSKGD